MDVSELISIEQVPERGLGIVAKRRIAQGTRMLTEPPMMVSPPRPQSDDDVRSSVAEQLKCLNREQQRVFFSLHNARDADPLVNIFRVNALPLGPTDRTYGLFPRAARINHSCIPNAEHAWNANIGRITIHATRDIKEGEEVTVCYIDASLSYSERVEYFHEKFAFECKCQLCSLPIAERSKAFEVIERLDDLMTAVSWPRDVARRPLSCLHKTLEALNLMKDAYMPFIGNSHAYGHAFLIASTHKDAARTKIFAERAKARWVIVAGEDHPGAIEMQEHLNNISSAPEFGYTQRWKTEIDDIPTGLSEQDFENWLWRLGKWAEPPDEEPSDDEDEMQTESTSTGYRLVALTGDERTRTRFLRPL